MTEENGIPTRTDLADIPEQTPEDKRKRDEVEECMRDVIDPELGINVVDLGLVYSIWIENGVDAPVGAEHDHRGRAGTIARPRLQRLVPEGSRVPFTPQIC